MGSLLRKEDEKCADIVSKFLDGHFYNNVDSFKRINTKEEQVKGIDTIFQIDGEEYLCDEKAAIRYVNKNLQTFAMELSFIDRGGNLHEGWLIDDNKVNNSFLFVWIDKAKNDILKSVDDIQELEYMLEKRDKIIEYLNRLGWAKNRLIEKTKLIREDALEYLGRLDKNGCKFVYSGFLYEKPVNVLIARDVLREISLLNKKIIIK